MQSPELIVCEVVPPFTSHPDDAIPHLGGLPPGKNGV